MLIVGLFLNVVCLDVDLFFKAMRTFSQDGTVAEVKGGMIPPLSMQQ
ncbi:MAG: hypothetical protein HW380_2860 [Magnetococcales bacterium]|nr:hypothetical protein [Magnetococcales bacterium]